MTSLPRIPRITSGPVVPSILSFFVVPMIVARRPRQKRPLFLSPTIGPPSTGEVPVAGAERSTDPMSDPSPPGAFAIAGVVGDARLAALVGGEPGREALVEDRAGRRRQVGLRLAAVVRQPAERRVHPEDVVARRVDHRRARRVPDQAEARGEPAVGTGAGLGEVRPGRRRVAGDDRAVEVDRVGAALGEVAVDAAAAVRRVVVHDGRAADVGHARVVAGVDAAAVLGGVARDGRVHHLDVRGVLARDPPSDSVALDSAARRCCPRSSSR